MYIEWWGQQQEPIMFIVVQVRKRGAIGISYDKGFEIPEPGATETPFTVWQKHYGDAWEPLSGVKPIGVCARTACGIPNALCNHTHAPYRMYCPKCARAINGANGDIVQFPEKL
jgi:hypothetical protein